MWRELRRAARHSQSLDLNANPYLLERKVREKCATLSEKLSAWVSTFPVLAPYSTFIGIFVVVGAITYFSLIIGESCPNASRSAIPRVAPCSSPSR